MRILDAIVSLYRIYCSEQDNMQALQIKTSCDIIQTNERVEIIVAEGDYKPCRELDICNELGVEL